MDQLSCDNYPIKKNLSPFFFFFFFLSLSLSKPIIFMNMKPYSCIWYEYDYDSTEYYVLLGLFLYLWLWENKKTTEKKKVYTITIHNHKNPKINIYKSKIYCGIPYSLSIYREKVTIIIWNKVTKILILFLFQYNNLWFLLKATT